jgi:hypothetical protein
MIGTTAAGSCENANCLATAQVVTFRRAAEVICGEYAGPATGYQLESAARVIFKVQQACGISARVLLVTLQKEQGLLTATAPTDS